MPKGGYREGAGRKSKAEELGLPALIDEVIGEEGKRQLIEIIFKSAVPLTKTGKPKGRGSGFHQELLMHYIFGKPTGEVKVNGTLKLEQIKGMVVK